MGRGLRPDHLQCDNHISLAPRNGTHRRVPRHCGDHLRSDWGLRGAEVQSHCPNEDRHPVCRESSSRRKSPRAAREADAGTNVFLLEPFDSVVFERAATRDGLRCVAPSQLAVDLLTGPGREPTQGEELLRWMEDNEAVWRGRLEA